MTKRSMLIVAVLVAVFVPIWLQRDEFSSELPARKARSVSEDSRHGRGLAELNLIEADAANASRASATVEYQAPVSTGDATLRLLVIDQATHDPLAGVRITIHPREPGHVSTSIAGNRATFDESPITADDGRAEFELPAGIELRLTAYGEYGTVGRIDQSLSPLLPDEERDLTLRLPSGNDVRYFGRVLARETRAPIANARVQLMHGERFWGATGGQPEGASIETAVVAEKRTAPDGLFEVLLPSWRGSDIRVEAQGFAMTIVHGGIDHVTPESANVIYLSRSASLTARLLGASGTPISDATVRLWADAYLLSVGHHGEIYLPETGDVEWKATSDESGTCRFEELPPDVEFRVELKRAGRTNRRLPPLCLSPGEAREVEWMSDSGALIEGVIVDQQRQPVPDRTIWLQRAGFDSPELFQEFQTAAEFEETTSNAEGRFEFRDVRHGKWWIGAAPGRGYRQPFDPNAIAPLAQVVEIPEGATRHELALNVFRGIYIRGRVLDPKGEPAPKVFVHAGVAAGMSTARTEEDGTFTLGPLVPGPTPLFAMGGSYGNSEPVDANAGDTNVVLQLKNGGTMSGRVVDGTSGIGCAAQVTYSVRGTAIAGMLESDANGSFGTNRLSPGTYDIAARSSGQRTGVLHGVLIASSAETHGLVVTLAPGSTLRMKYPGIDDAVSYRVLQEEVLVAWDGVVRGQVKEITVPAGRLMIEYRSRSGWSEQKSVDLAVGQVVQIVLDRK